MLETVQISLMSDQRVSITQSDSKNLVISQVSIPRKEWEELMAKVVWQTKSASHTELMQLITALSVLLEDS
ncbi:hypothetical protein HWB90_gp067 [Mycobacterium phage Fowlmouth]|uniref:Uncharacterized protein n=2 Tax=Fowlmouthvirus fowlmouth TaxID=2845652 RepID=A0A7G8LPV8_9CAUD|nr:hypothetical protein HWB90_gp067 [Mycobacterium phage Fowlmouth]AYN58017.1 hypothetical protein SEA_FOWLMOUTH_67 [Mycobacterium phage Fowlmouth]QNJ59280.1 hypothetical protein SEA_MRMIYAGI_66 [Mycobacterium phage MrMiyagi]